MFTVLDVRRRSRAAADAPPATPPMMTTFIYRTTLPR